MHVTAGLALMVVEMLLFVPAVAFSLGSIRMCGELRRDQSTYFRTSLVFTLAVVFITALLLADIIRRMVSG